MVMTFVNGVDKDSIDVTACIGSAMPVPLADMKNQRLDTIQSIVFKMPTDIDPKHLKSMQHTRIRRECRKITHQSPRAIFVFDGEGVANPLLRKFLSYFNSISCIELVGLRGKNIAFDYGAWFDDLRQIVPGINMQYIKPIGLKCSEWIGDDSFLLITDDQNVYSDAVSAQISINSEQFLLLLTDGEAEEEIELSIFQQKLYNSYEKPQLIAKISQHSEVDDLVKFLDERFSQVARNNENVESSEKEATFRSIDIIVIFNDIGEQKLTFSSAGALQNLLEKFKHQEYSIEERRYSAQGEQVLNCVSVNSIFMIARLADVELPLLPSGRELIELYLDDTMKDHKEALVKWLADDESAKNVTIIDSFGVIEGAIECILGPEGRGVITWITVTARLYDVNAMELLFDQKATKICLMDGNGSEELCGRIEERKEEWEIKHVTGEIFTVLIEADFYRYTKIPQKAVETL